MTSNLAFNDTWNQFWTGHVGNWLATKGLHIALVVLFALVATRVIRWGAGRISRRLDRGGDGDAALQPERVKHRRAVASVISSVAIAVLYIVVAVDIANQLGLPIGSLVAPAAVLGAAFGFGAQRIVQDLLSGFFIITEKQYGFGDLVQLSVTSGGDARGTVEDVTLRVTKVRTSDGEVYTVPNGQIVKSLNLSKDWARAVVDVPVPASADINHVTDLLRDVSKTAMDDDGLPDLLLDEPALMGVESIEKDTVNLQVVARTLPGKQFEVGRRLRALIVSTLRREGVADAELASSRSG
ncbi:MULTISPECIES: mechanosensitive ion channel family protein [unclassified Mycobacterium]|uniref:mechanosensitive ion channel family protein n=1 Tax=unclassified Mycobacterium TaxID=2642494 RepID=UPI00073FF165|nr:MULTISPECIES: mechanosensitive ion channel family protein [unclassified Mycobacterium]KUH85728.1 mechanosensitive ion channel protein MscS [Mycobacterium sp. GA-1999]KUH91585.1 mechanosensitive ion channel protein MscS [Mycobacterium sp. GA-0227b]KUH96176.1 mechanosensitive ion channel protein MscS [Mycobacterium sp. IS-1556]